MVRAEKINSLERCLLKSKAQLLSVMTTVQESGTPYTLSKVYGHGQMDINKAAEVKLGRKAKTPRNKCKGRTDDISFRCSCL